MPPPQVPAPVDVGTATQLWWGVAGLGVVQIFAVIAFAFGQRSSVVDQFMADPALLEAGTQVSRGSVEVMFAVALVFVTAMMLGSVALFVLFVHLMREGRNWARMLLTMVGAMMAMLALQILIGVGSLDGGLNLTMGGVQILQAVVAVGAIALMHRKDSNAYFLKFPPTRS